MGSGIRKRIFIDCASTIPVQQAALGAAAAGSDNTTEVFVAGGHQMEIRFEQACADVLPTRVIDANTTTGWQVPNDNADNDGAEMGFGIIGDADAKHCFKVGTDPAFEFEVKMGVPDVSEYDVLAIGFRSAAAYADAINTPAALLAAYSGATEHKFCINIEAGDVHVQKTTNGADVEEDVSVTDVVDDQVFTLKVAVSAAGVPSAYFDGTEITLTTVDTAFDTGDLLVPFIIWCKGAANTDTPPIIEYIKCGYGS